MIRAFLAVEVRADLRDRIVRIQTDLRRRIEEAGRAGGRQARISWTSPGAIHLTLKFFGDLDEASVDSIGDAVDRAVSVHAGTSLSLDRIGIFPGARDPRVIWVGPGELWETSAAAAALRELHGRIDDACATLGLARDAHPIRPHLTIARVRWLDAPVARALTAAASQRVDLAALTVDHVTFFSSRLGSSGATHAPIWRIALAGS